MFKFIDLEKLRRKFLGRNKKMACLVPDKNINRVFDELTTLRKLREDAINHSCQR